MAIKSERSSSLRATAQPDTIFPFGQVVHGGFQHLVHRLVRNVISDVRIDPENQPGESREEAVAREDDAGFAVPQLKDAGSEVVIGQRERYALQGQGLRMLVRADVPVIPPDNQRFQNVIIGNQFVAYFAFGQC